MILSRTVTESTPLGRRYTRDDWRAAYRAARLELGVKLVPHAYRVLLASWAYWQRAAMAAADALV